MCVPAKFVKCSLNKTTNNSHLELVIYLLCLYFFSSSSQHIEKCIRQCICLGELHKHLLDGQTDGWMGMLTMILCNTVEIVITLYKTNIVK